MNILAIVPARGGSKGIPRKNIKLLNGKPLLAYTVEVIKNSKLIDRAICSTDDDEIINIANNYGLDAPFKRPDELAQDDTPSILVLQHAVKKIYELYCYIPEIIVNLQPTSPFRDKELIDNALNIFMNSEDADSLVSVEKIPHNYSPFSAMELHDNYIRPLQKIDEQKNNRNEKPEYFARNGALNSICTYDCLVNKNSLYGNKIIPFFMSREDSVDIDDDFDWFLAEYIMSKNN